MTEIAFTFPLANGLHARPASLLQETCLRHDARVRFLNQRNRRRADAGSVLELVASGTVGGDPCLLEISGPQEKEAARALRAFLKLELAQADDNPPPGISASVPAGWLPPVFRGGAHRLFSGRVLATGIGCAASARLRKPRPLRRGFAAGGRDPRKELAHFQKAAGELQAELGRKAGEAREPSAAGILKAHLAIVSDPGFAGSIAGLIARKKIPAGAAIEETAARFARVLKRSRSVYLRERASDLEDISARLQEKLYGRPSATASLPSRGGYIVMAADISPSELLSLDRRRLRGLVLGEVGSTTHSAILARSFGIPAVSLPRRVLAKISSGEELVVDGRRGLVIDRPGPALKRYYRMEERGLRLDRRQRQPARTRDGRRLEIAANIGSPLELAAAWRNGAEAIGLFRSEILFLERDAPPGEDEQFAAYSQAARAAGGRPMIIRTLDVGGDKRLPYLPLPREENPFLGFRAVRFYPEQEELIRCQLRAILRAARFGRLKVMVPMVTGLEEVVLVRRLLSAAASELRSRRVAHKEKIELGVMVETPAAALSLDLLAREADFFSVGSNDLLQYFLAADRGNARLGALYDPLHPAFLRLLVQTAALARKARRWLGICGEMAGNPELLPLLVGIGFDELSMASGLIPAVKEGIGKLDSGECRALLRRALRCAGARDVARLLQEFHARSGGVGAAAAVIDPDLVRLDSASRTSGEAIKELSDLLEISGRVTSASALEEAVWKREETYATDLGFGFALPHAKAAAVRSSSIAFLRPAHAIRWTMEARSRVRGVLMIAIPERLKGEEHLRLIARLSRRLMHEDFRAALLGAASRDRVTKLIADCLREGE